jgi:hypothetical protein
VLALFSNAASETKLRRVFAEAVPDGFPDAKDAEKVARRTVVVREG